MTASQCGALVARIKHGRNAFTRIAKFVSALLSVYSRSPPSYQLARFPPKWNRFDDKKARQDKYAGACSYRQSAYTLPERAPVISTVMGVPIDHSSARYWRAGLGPKQAAANPSQ